MEGESEEKEGRKERRDLVSISRPAILTEKHCGSFGCCDWRRCTLVARSARAEGRSRGLSFRHLFIISLVYAGPVLVLVLVSV